MTDSPFVIEKYANDTYSVTWPGHVCSVVNNPAKALKLLEILFDVVGVDQAMIITEDHYRDKRTMYISNVVWYQDDRTREFVASRVAKWTVPGVRFTDIYQAEKFKDHMEKLLMWKILSNKEAA